MSIQEYRQRKTVYARRARELDAEKRYLLAKRQELLAEVGYSLKDDHRERLRKIVMSMSYPVHWCFERQSTYWKSIAQRIVYKNMEEVTVFDDSIYIHRCENEGGSYNWHSGDFYHILVEHNILPFYFALVRIQRAVRRWLEQPAYSNGHVGFHARKSWEEAGLSEIVQTG